MAQTYFDGWLWHDSQGIHIQNCGSELIVTFPRTEGGYTEALLFCQGIAKVLISTPPGTDREEHLRAGARNILRKFLGDRK